MAWKLGRDGVIKTSRKGLTHEDSKGSWEITEIPEIPKGVFEILVA